MSTLTGAPGRTADTADDGAEPPRRRLPVGRRTLVIVAAVVVLLAGLAIWLVAFSSVFGVGTVVVRGVPVAQQDEVRGVAAVPDGTPLVRLDTAAIRSRVATLPDIASVVVTTSFPSTVTIAVTERIPVGVVRSGSGFVLVDRTGDQFRSVARRPAHLPLFVVPAGSDARATGQAVATVAGALPADIRARVQSVQAFDATTITLVLDNGRVVRWGSAAQSAQKAIILPALLHRSADQIDVSDPDRPFTR